MTKREWLLSIGLVTAVVTLGSTTVLGTAGYLMQRKKNNDYKEYISFEKDYNDILSKELDESKVSNVLLNEEIDILKEENEGLRIESELNFDETLLYQLYSYDVITSYFAKEEPKEGQFVVLKCGYGFIAKTDDYNEHLNKNISLMTVLWPELSVIYNLNIDHAKVVGYYDTYEEALNAALGIDRDVDPSVPSFDDELDIDEPQKL